MPSSFVFELPQIVLVKRYSSFLPNQAPFSQENINFRFKMLFKSFYPNNIFGHLELKLLRMKIRQINLFSLMKKGIIYMRTY